MRARILTSFVLLMLILTATNAARGQETKPDETTKNKKKSSCPLHCAPEKIKVFDLGSSNFTGDQIRGPRIVRADNLNPLRYNYKFSNTITFSQPVDLWSKLQGAAVPSAANPPAQPAAPAPKTPAPKGIGAPPPAAPKVSKGTQTLVDQAEGMVAKAEAAIHDASAAITTASGTINPGANPNCPAIVPVGLDVTRETNRQSDCLANEVAAETLAVTEVKSAGQSLIRLLQGSGTPPELLMANIDQEAIAQSFTQGINASWPAPDRTETLRRSAEGLKIELGDRKAKFNADVPKMSGAMIAAGSQLSDIKETLDVEAKKNKGNDQKALTDEAAIVQDTLTRLDNTLKELTKTTNLLDWAIGEDQRVFGVIPDLEPSSSKYTDFQTAREALVTWQTRMTDLQKRWKDYQAGLKSGKSDEDNPNPFSLSTSADCEFAFSRTKTTAVVLTRVDLMPGTTASGPETVL